MFSRLIEYVTTLPPEELLRVPIQDIAVCAAWHDSHADDAAQQGRYPSIPAVVQSWLAVMAPDPGAIQGGRHQFMLRDLIAELAAGRVEQFTWDELHFIHKVFEFACHPCSGGGNPFARVRALLERQHDAAVARLRSLAPVPGLPALANRMHFVAAEDLARSRPREISLFAGIGIQSRGPVFFHKSGHLKVLDQVPENCTVVVENGSCCINGFLFGKVAASQHCDVRENVAGVVVVRQGNVHARNLLVKAYVVSKWGGVHCRKSEAPELVFGGREIVVEETARMGTYIAPRIQIGEEAIGGVYHVSVELIAKRFRRTDSRELMIFLRQDLSCEDYGEVPGPEALRLMSRAARVRRQLADLRTQIAYTESEAEHAARGAIVYLTGGGQLHPQVAERMQYAQQRLALMNRLVAMLRTVVEMAEDRLHRMARAAGKATVEDQEGHEESSRNFDQMHSEATAFENEMGSETDIHEEFEGVRGLKNSLFALGADTKRVSNILHLLRDRYDRWTREREELNAGIRRYEAELQEIIRGQEKVLGARSEMSRVDLLRQLVAAMKERGLPADDPMVKRLQSTFIRIALRNVNSRTERGRALHQSLGLRREEFRAVAESLRREYQIVLTEGQPDDGPGATVTGRFERGVRIYADPYLVDEAAPPNDSVIETSDTGDSVQTFRRERGHVFLQS
jgi:hypothetical protein